jgi:ABC-type uncharacterized transport system permease subunit
MQQNKIILAVSIIILCIAITTTIGQNPSTKKAKSFKTINIEKYESEPFNYSFLKFIYWDILCCITPSNILNLLGWTAQ